MSGETLLELRFPARADRLKEVRAAVQKAIRRAGIESGCARDVVMAVDEACQNVIRHAYGGECDQQIELRIEREAHALVVWLRDRAPAIDPSKVKPRPLDEVRPGGLGVHLIRETMDETEFLRPPDGGNLLRMRKEIG